MLEGKKSRGDGDHIQQLKGGIEKMEDHKNYSRVAHYLKLFEEVKAKVSDDAVAMAIVEQVGKDSRVEKMSGLRSGNVQGRTAEVGEQPATEKQLGFLRRLNVDIPAGLSKREASRLIDEAQAVAAQ